MPKFCSLEELLKGKGFKAKMKIKEVFPDINFKKIRTQKYLIPNYETDSDSDWENEYYF